MRALSVVLMLLVAPAIAGAQHTVLAPANCPVCTEAQKMAWAATHDSTFRVRAKDLLGHRIGLNRANTFSGKAKYRPILHDKQIGCGKFVSFGLYTNDKGEWDWNIRVTPTAYSRAMHDAIRNATPAEKLQEWPCNGDCFKGEITTDNGFRDNPYFNVDVPYVTINFLGFEIPVEPDVSEATSILTTSDTLCMYGPWVQDLGHSDHAEIHPSEVIWWRDRATGAVYAIIAQDDTNRFDRAGDFRMDDQPNWSRPWSAFPRWTELRVAFAADAAGTAPGWLTVDDIEAHRILTKYNNVASRDSDDGDRHALQYNGNVIMNVRELENPSDRIGVTFVDMCRLATDEGELIIGYVALQTVISDHDRGDGGDARDEGYYVLKLTFDEPIRWPPITANFNGLISRLRAVRTSRSSADSIARSTPIADRLARDPRAPRYMLSMTPLRASGGVLVGDLSGRRLASGAAAAAVRGSARLNARPGARIPLTRGGTFTIRDGQDSIRFRIPSHRLSGSVHLDSVTVAGRDADAASAVASFLGDNVNEAAVARHLMRVRRRVVEITPEYSGQRDETTDHLGDETALAEILNAAIDGAAQGDRARLLRLYGNPQPFTISWSFTARNLATGETIPLATAPARANAPVVQISSGSFSNSRLTIHMPQSGVFEVTASARFRDADGIEGTFSHTVQSHQLNISSPEELLDVMGSVRASAVRIDTGAGVSGARRAVAANLAQHATADGIVTLRELTGLRAAIDNVGR